MKSIELKTVAARAPDGNPVTLDYRAQIEAIIRTPQNQQQGMDIEELRRSLRILEALERAQESLILEDADYAFLVQKVKSARFRWATKEVAQFVADVMGE